MALRSIGSATISFGLVSIPVELYTATSSQRVSFNLLHAKCGSRIKQQNFCPTCNLVVERSDLVRGYQHAKGEYVQISEEELDAMEEESSRVIDIAEFVPLPKVDPIYFENTYYLGPDKAGEKPYRLLADAMAKTDRVALAKYVMRGKENLVLIRPAKDGLMLHVMRYADEIRDFGEVDKGSKAAVRDAELKLAIHLIDQLTNKEFKPEQYHDQYRERVMELVNQKLEGKKVVRPPAAPARGQVIDLMEALKQSLNAETPAKKAARARRAEAAATPAKKARASRK
jgi:DNA end-binding protein Ku